MTSTARISHNSAVVSSSLCGRRDHHRAKSESTEATLYRSGVRLQQNKSVERNAIASPKHQACNPCVNVRTSCSRIRISRLCASYGPPYHPLIANIKILLRGRRWYADDGGTRLNDNSSVLSTIVTTVLGVHAACYNRSSCTGRFVRI